MLHSPGFWGCSAQTPLDLLRTESRPAHGGPGAKFCCGSTMLGAPSLLRPPQLPPVPSVCGCRVLPASALPCEPCSGRPFPLPPHCVRERPQGCPEPLHGRQQRGASHEETPLHDHVTRFISSFALQPLGVHPHTHRPITGKVQDRAQGGG